MLTFIPMQTAIEQLQYPTPSSTLQTPVEKLDDKKLKGQLRSEEICGRILSQSGHHLTALGLTW